MSRRSGEMGRFSHDLSLSSANGNGTLDTQLKLNEYKHLYSSRLFSQSHPWLAFASGLLGKLYLSAAKSLRKEQDYTHRHDAPLSFLP